MLLVLDPLSARAATNKAKLKKLLEETRNRASARCAALLESIEKREALVVPDRKIPSVTRRTVTLKCPSCGHEWTKGGSA